MNHALYTALLSFLLFTKNALSMEACQNSPETVERDQLEGGSLLDKLPKDILDKVILPYLVDKYYLNDLIYDYHESEEEFKFCIKNAKFGHDPNQCRKVLDLFPNFKSTARLKFDVLSTTLSHNDEYKGILRTLGSGCILQIFDANLLQVYEEKFKDLSCRAFSITSNGRHCIKCLEKDEHYDIEITNLHSKKTKIIGVMPKMHDNAYYLATTNPLLILNQSEKQVAIKVPVSAPIGDFHRRRGAERIGFFRQCAKIFTISDAATFSDLLIKQKFICDPKSDQPQSLSQLFHKIGIAKNLKN